MGDRSRVYHLVWNQPYRRTQPPTPAWWRRMSAAQSVLTLCGWGVKAGMWLISLVD